MDLKTVGSICSGIEAASVAWMPIGFDFKWFSEIAPFPSKVLKAHYPDVPNVGDMTEIPQMIVNSEIEAPDLLCGGTPCQAFSLAGWKNGLEDDRGNLTLKFVDIIEANDHMRERNGKAPTVVFWENVEGVLTDKTNAFGSLVSSLAGLKESIYRRKWPAAGLLRGPKRNVAWRVLDAKYFGLPQQRRRLYLLAEGKDFSPESILFDRTTAPKNLPKDTVFTFDKHGVHFELFREYTDCLYSSYGTKWNGNAAAYNGSLYVVQDNRIRRLSPLECERLMGFPDGYTDIPGATRTTRYQALGNSWAVPVIRWIGQRLSDGNITSISDTTINTLGNLGLDANESYNLFDLTSDHIADAAGHTLNTSVIPSKPAYGSMVDIVDENPPSKIYISPTGCYGIIRRKNERNLKINSRLEQILIGIAKESTIEEIEKRSRVQKRGRFSSNRPDSAVLLF